MLKTFELALAGDLVGLEQAHENGAPWHEWTMDAATHHIDCMKYAHEHGCPWSPTTTESAARAKTHDTMRYAHENGAVWHPKTTCAAAEGRLATLKYAHENGAPWSDWTMTRASDGHLDCMKYAHEHGCPWDGWTGQEVAIAASRGHLDCLRYALDHGASWNDWCVKLVMKWHYGCSGYPCDSRPRFELAVEGYDPCNHRECIRMIFDHDRRPTVDTQRIAWIRQAVLRLPEGRNLVVQAASA